MEIPLHFDDDNPPTFGQMLELTAAGKAIGFTVFTEDDMRYTFFEEGEDIDTPEEGETWIPMTLEDAQSTLNDLREDGIEELDEIGKRDIGNPSTN